jgi:hypothetical protein
MRLRVLCLVALVFLVYETPAVASRPDPTRVSPPRRITASSAAQLQLAWTANTGSYTSPPAVVDGVVYVGTKNGPLYAFPATCGSEGATCQPLWTGHSGGETIDLAGDEVFWSPVVVDGDVLVLGDHPKQVKAFSTSCAARCQPLWVGDIGAPRGPCASCPSDAGNAYVTESDGIAYVDAFYGHLYAFPGNCRTDGMACQPLWVAPAGDPAGSLEARVAQLEDGHPPQPPLGPARLLASSGGLAVLTAAGMCCAGLAQALPAGML